MQSDVLGAEVEEILLTKRGDNSRMMIVSAKTNVKEDTLVKNRIWKLIALNLGIAVLNIILFASGLVGLNFTGSIFQTALAITVIVMSLIAFGYGNYTLLFSERKMQLLRGTELTEPKDYVQALQDMDLNGVFDADIHTATEQIGRMQDKDKALNIILAQFFTPQEMTFTRFQSAINAVQAIFYNNVKKMLNRMTIFDYADYRKLKKISSASDKEDDETAEAVEAQKRIYQEHIDYVHDLVKMNESVLVKMDALLLELSKLDDVDEQGLEKMAAVQEINDLIEQTKYYKT